MVHVLEIKFIYVQLSYNSARTRWRRRHHTPSLFPYSHWVSGILAIRFVPPLEEEEEVENDLEWRIMIHEQHLKQGLFDSRKKNEAQITLKK